MSSKNDAVNESLSALIDNEHDELDLRRALKASDNDVDVVDTLAAYQLQRQILRKEVAVVCSPNFLEGIRSAIDAEVPHSLPASETSGQRRIWAGYFGKAAIAASFSFVFLFAASQLQYSPIDQGADLAAQSGGANRQESLVVVPSGFELPPLNARTVSSSASGSSYKPYMDSRSQSRQPRVLRQQKSKPLSPEMQAHVDHLLMQHSRHSVVDGGFGILPMARAKSTVNSDDEGDRGTSN